MNMNFRTAGFVVVDYEDDDNRIYAFGDTRKEALENVPSDDLGRGLHLDVYPASPVLYAAASNGGLTADYCLNVDGILFIQGEQYETDAERAKATFLREREADANRYYDNAGVEEAEGRYGYAADYRRAGDLSLSVFSTDK